MTQDIVEAAAGFHSAAHAGFASAQDRTFRHSFYHLEVTHMCILYLLFAVSAVSRMRFSTAWEDSVLE